MNAGLVCEGTVSTGITVRQPITIMQISNVRDGVHEGDVDFDGFCDQVLNLAKHREVVLGLDVFGVGSVETCDETSEGGDTDTLTNTKNG